MKSHLSNIIASVIIPAFSFELLKVTLQSIINQQYNKNKIEVIIVNDGSGEFTCDMLKYYRKYVIINYIFQENKGYRVASARNLGIINARGKILIFVDAGIVLGTNTIKEHINLHMRKKNSVISLGYIFGMNLEKKNETELKKIIDLNNIDNSIEYLKDKKEFSDTRELSYSLCNDKLDKLAAPWSLLWTGNVSIRKKDILKFGLFDINFDFNYGIEDIELGYRLYMNNFYFINNRKAAAIRYPHKSNIKNKNQQIQINKLYFYNKYKSKIIKEFIALNPNEINLNGSEPLKLPVLPPASP